MLSVMTGANLGLSLTLNLEQYEDLAGGHDDEAGVVVRTAVISSLFVTSDTHSDKGHKHMSSSSLFLSGNHS